MTGKRPFGKISTFAGTACRLGIWNVVRVLTYRLASFTGLLKFRLPRRKLPEGTVYDRVGGTRADYPAEWSKHLTEEADSIISGNLCYFSYHRKKVGSPPNWFLNPFTGKHYPHNGRHWSRLPDFHPDAGDIKCIWEASRFEWVVTLARAYVVTGRKEYISTLNRWLSDWMLNNPVNSGPNWKCGQEASFRLFNLANAALILERHDDPSPVLARLVSEHLGRINGSLGYALAQNNNHSLSEAGGLYIGGTWLARFAEGEYPSSKAYARKGRKLLERQVKKLVFPDGSFSQHSVNYHRLLLDILSYAELWRRILSDPPFSDTFYSRSEAATQWLENITVPSNGRSPNFGPNDGTRLNSMTSAGYGDYRPSLQLAGALFCNRPLFPAGAWDEPLWWFSVSKSNYAVGQPGRPSLLLPGGYVIIHQGNSFGFLRLPHFRFRPHHNDIFHLDLWHGGRNILCDAGTYSYNPPSGSELHLESVRFHNTVSFDGEEQMPRIGRFLLGNWLSAEKTGEIVYGPSGEISWQGSYICNYGNRHLRKIVAAGDRWIVEDTLDGKFDFALIGFNLNFNECTLEGKTLLFPAGTVTCPPDASVSLNGSFASEHYLAKEPVKRLTIRVTRPGTYITTFNLHEDTAGSSILPGA